MQATVTFEKGDRVKLKKGGRAEFEVIEVKPEHTSPAGRLVPEYVGCWELERLGPRMIRSRFRAFHPEELKKVKIK